MLHVSRPNPVRLPRRTGAKYDAELEELLDCSVWGNMARYRAVVYAVRPDPFRLPRRIVAPKKIF